jgi:hypothetical protein
LVVGHSSHLFSFASCYCQPCEAGRHGGYWGLPQYPTYLFLIII